MARVLPDTRAFLAPAIANTFEELHISAAIRDGGPWTKRGEGWRAIHVAEPNISYFELEHGVELERAKYNDHCMNQALEENRLVRAQHAGLTDLFVPICVDGVVSAVLATGPFMTARPTAADVVARWRWLTRREGHPSDPEFLHYLSVTLATLVLEGRRLGDFERFVTCLTRLMAGERPGTPLLAEAEALRRKLNETRAAEHTWATARSMVDERTERSWSSPQRTAALRELGLSKMVDHVLVGLVVGRQQGADPVDEILRRDALQRASVDLARKSGDAIAGQVGDYGVAFLAATSGSGRQRDRPLLALLDRATTLARRFGLSLHAGLSALPRTALVSEQYQAALGAAELALSERTRIVRALPERAPETLSLHRLRTQFGALVLERPAELPAHFERYLEAVSVHCHHRIEPVRVHLEAGFEHIASAALEAHVLEEKTGEDMGKELARAAGAARTVVEIAAVYRRAVLDMSEAVQRPTPARHERTLRRAVAYIQRHYTEPLRRGTLARLSGFAPNYFSELFKRQQGMSFERYVQKLRVDRAKQLLSTTELNLARVAALSGLGSRFHLGHVFRRVVGQTPLYWRTHAEGRSGNTKR